MAFEAMNNAGAMDSRMVVILNDNDMSIAPPVGAMSAYLARILSRQNLSFVPPLAERFEPPFTRKPARKSAANGRIYARFYDRRHAV